MVDGAVPRVMIKQAVLDIERQRIVKDTKNHGQRWIRIDGDTAALLHAHRDQAVKFGEVAALPLTRGDYVFPSVPCSSEPLPPNRISQAWRRLCREEGVDARLHDLRHLQASLLLDAARRFRALRDEPGMTGW